MTWWVKSQRTLFDGGKGTAYDLTQTDSVSTTVDIRTLPRAWGQGRTGPHVSSVGHSGRSLSPTYVPGSCRRLPCLPPAVHLQLTLARWPCCAIAPHRPPTLPTPLCALARVPAAAAFGAATDARQRPTSVRRRRRSAPLAPPSLERGAAYGPSPDERSPELRSRGEVNARFCLLTSSLVSASGPL